MLRFMCAFMYLTFSSSVVLAQNAKDICELGGTTKLFIAKDGKKFISKLKRGTKVVLEERQGKRRMVETTQGKLGFIKESWLKQTCKFTTPPPPKKARKPKRATPMDAGSNGEAAAAVELARVAAENPEAVEPAVIDSQAEVIQNAREARAASREIESSDLIRQETYRVAVYDLELVNIPEGMGTIITASLLSEVRKLEGASAIGMEEIRDMISFEAQRQVMGCDADEACWAEIAGVLGVDEIITGRLSEEADTRSFLVRRINQGRGEVVTTVNKRLSIGSGEEFLLAIGPVVEELYPKRPNRPGTKRGVAKKVLLRLNPPPIAPFTTLSTIGVSVAALAVGSTFALMGQNEVAHYNLGAGQGSGLYSGEDLNPFHDAKSKAESYVMIGNIGLIAGGALALTSTVMSLFTDWAMLGKNVGDEE